MFTRAPERTRHVVPLETFLGTVFTQILRNPIMLEQIISQATIFWSLTSGLV